MTGYELVFITDPSLSEKEIESVLKKIKKSLPNQVENLFMNMSGGADVWLTKFQVMIMVFITPGTLLVQEKQ